MIAGGAKPSQFPELAGSRQVFDLSVDMVQTSSETGVPAMVVQHQRAPIELTPFYHAMGAEGVSDYWRRNKSLTIGGAANGIFSND